MSPGARKASSGGKTKPAALDESGGAKPKPRGSGELGQAAEQDRSRAEALEALYRPLREATEAELQKTKSGRKLLEDAQTIGTELGVLLEGVSSGRTPREEAGLLLRERHEQFHKRYGDQLVQVQGKYVNLQPSVEAVVQILRPEGAAQTTWVAETSLRRSMLLQPKRAPGNVAVVGQGLGALPPLVQSCVTPPYDLRDDSWVLPFDNLTGGGTGEVFADATHGVTIIDSSCYAGLGNGVDVSVASAFVGHDFAVPRGPTGYEATISYDWFGRGYGSVVLGLAIVNVDLAIVIDKRDGTRETHAREVSLFTLPFSGSDGFHHETDDARISIPFTRDGSNGTVRIMVGVDGHCMAIVAFGGAAAGFHASARVREICLTSVP